MSLEKNIILGKLFDLYGPLLSKNQYEIMDDFLNNDLTLSEVAENRGVTRQAIKDTVSKVEKKLEDFENKLCFLRKLEEIKNSLKEN